MGQFLSVGICTEFYFNSEKPYRFFGTEEEFNIAFNKELAKEFAIELYDKTIEKDDDKEYVVYKIKPQILEDNIIELLKQQLSLYSNINDDVNEVLKNLENKKFDDIMEIAENKEFFCFQLLPYYSQYIENKSVNMTFVTLFSEGKIMMECYGPLFSYFENMIHTACKDNILSKALKVRIMG